MSRGCLSIAFAGRLAATAACGSDSSKSPKPSSPAAAPDAKKVDAATASKVTGRVVFEGTPPQNPVINMGSDSACGAGSKTDVTSESIVLDNGAVQHRFGFHKRRPSDKSRLH